MRYLVVRKVEARRGSGFTELVSDRPAGRPFAVETVELSDVAASEARNDPAVEDLILAVPFTLIEPVDDPAPAAAAAAWGIDAIGAASSDCSGRGVTVAVLDTGIDRRHAAFRHLPLEESDLRDFTADPDGIEGSAPDDHGHGTHVAATLVGGTVDGQRLGVAPGVRRALIGKVLGPSGATTDAIYNGIEWAIRNRADVICLSLGIDFPGTIAKVMAHDGLPRDIAESRAFEAFRDNVRLFDRQAGVLDARDFRRRSALLVAATGNASRRREHPRHTMAAVTPAASEGFIAVGAVGRAAAGGPYEVAPFSNTGARLAGPGVSILSARAGGGLRARSGTSMAVPHVAGAAALWIERLQGGSAQRAEGWAEDVRVALYGHARPLPGLSRRDVGHGLVQAPRAAG